MKSTGHQKKISNLKLSRSGFADTYLSKQINPIPFIQAPPSGLLRSVVVVPAYMENSILRTLFSLKNCTLPNGVVEVLILINFPENEPTENKEQSRELHKDLERWAKENSVGKMKFIPLLAADLPLKHAGAGMARKIGMDQALQRFNTIGQPKGLILSLDADSVVDPNYFTAIEEKIYGKDEYGGCILNFQHPISGNEFLPETYLAIVQYELHLRYYKQILKYTGFPYYQFTIGSCFGVRADLYARMGGMNRRKAGEDFYFLHKMFPHKPFADIYNTCVYPSPRPSMRVPFGTGATITQMLNNKSEKFLTYSPEAFFELKQFLSLINQFCSNSKIEIEKAILGLPAILSQFLIENDIIAKIDEIKMNTASADKFIKRFYEWFDGFMVVKFLNYSHTTTYAKLPVEEAIAQFLIKSGYNELPEGAENLLSFFRKLDTNGINL
jgi:hypothetical protein